MRLDSTISLALNLIIANEHGLKVIAESPIDLEYFSEPIELIALASSGFSESISFYSIPYRPHLRQKDGSLLTPPLVTHTDTEMIIAIDYVRMTIYRA